MPYSDYENSVSSGVPIELFDIAMVTTHWYLTTAGEDIEYLGHTYESAPCECSAVKKTGDYPKDAVELKIPRDHSLAVMIVAGTPELIVSLTKYRCHAGNYIKEYTGYLTNFKFDGNSIPTLIFEPSASDMQIAGGRRKIMKLCPHKLYGYRCGVNNMSYEISGEIDTIDGVDITADAFGAVAGDDPAVYGDLTGLDGCVYDASSEQSIAPADGAFDNSLSLESVIPRHWWESVGSADQWISCQWTSAQIIKKVRIYKYLSNGIFSEYNARYFRVQGSDNGSDWTDIDAVGWEGDCQLYEGEGGSDTEILDADYSAWISVTLDNSEDYFYYRIYIFSNWGGTTIAIPEIEMMEADSSMAVHQFGAGGEIIVGISHRTIIAHNGDAITIDRPFPANVTAGMSFTAYAGCNHTIDCCRELFDNTINYGGLWHLPVKNPYIGRNSLVS